MKSSKEIPTPDKDHADLDLLHMPGRGTDDMESVHELPSEDAFCKITKLRTARRNARI